MELWNSYVIWIAALQSFILSNWYYVGAWITIGKCSRNCTLLFLFELWRRNLSSCNCDDLLFIFSCFPMESRWVSSVIHFAIHTCCCKLRIQHFICAHFLLAHLNNISLSVFNWKIIKWHESLSLMGTLSHF